MASKAGGVVGECTVVSHSDTAALEERQSVVLETMRVLAPVYGGIDGLCFVPMQLPP